MTGVERQVPSAELRCHCGNLLARVVPGGIELKCRRCRRRMLVELTPASPIGASARVRPSPEGED